MKLSGIVALLAALAFTGRAYASVVAFDMTVNDGTSPVTINVGETVTVKIYGVVTDNRYNSTDLGLALYSTDILTTGLCLDPINGYDPIAATWDHEWDVTWGIPGFAAKRRGNTDNLGADDDILGHGAGLTSFSAATSQIALTRTLLATGFLRGMSPGVSSITFGDAQANVMWYDGGYRAVPAQTVVAAGGTQVTVIPEPATMALLALGMAGILRRRIRAAVA